MSTSQDVIRGFEVQARACHSLGSALYGNLLDAAHADLVADGPVARVVEGWSGDAVREALALRFMAAIHRMVLTGAAPSLEAFYPSVGGWPVFPDVQEAFIDFVAENADHLRPQMTEPVQTNEVGRSSALLGGALYLAAEHCLPLRLFEIGSAGGLNLLFDRYRFELGLTAWGPLDSPVELASSWSGSLPPVGANIEIALRNGSDPNPVDVTTHAGAVRLQSFVWPDQPERLDTVRSAIDLVRDVGIHLESLPAAEFVESIGLEAGTVTVLMHTVMWQYVGREERERVRRAMVMLGAAATTETPLAWLSYEPRPQEFEIWLRVWPDGSERILGRGHPHGRWIEWE